MIIQDFDDFSLWVYYIVDELCQQVSPLLRRPGPQPTTASDSELLAMTIIGECRSIDIETEMLSFWSDHRDLFPRLPSQSRFNRRRRNLLPLVNLVRQAILRLLDVAQETICVIDSLPVPAVQFHLAPQARGDWAEHGAAFGKVSSKKQTIFGYKLQVLVTLGGVILDFELAPANASDLSVGEELLLNTYGIDRLGRQGLYLGGGARWIAQGARHPLAELASAEHEGAGAGGREQDGQRSAADHRNGERAIDGAVQLRAQPCAQFLGAVYALDDEADGSYVVYLSQSLAGECGLLADQASGFPQLAFHPSCLPEQRFWLLLLGSQ